MRGERAAGPGGNALVRLRDAASHREEAEEGPDESEEEGAEKKPEEDAAHASPLPPKGDSPAVPSVAFARRAAPLLAREDLLDGRSGSPAAVDAVGLVLARHGDRVW